MHAAGLVHSGQLRCNCYDSPAAAAVAFQSRLGSGQLSTCIRVNKAVDPKWILLNSCSSYGCFFNPCLSRFMTQTHVPIAS